MKFSKCYYGNKELSLKQKKKTVYCISRKEKEEKRKKRKKKKERREKNKEKKKEKRKILKHKLIRLNINIQNKYFLKCVIYYNRYINYRR